MDNDWFAFLFSADRDLGGKPLAVKASHNKLLKEEVKPVHDFM